MEAYELDLRVTSKQAIVKMLVYFEPLTKAFDLNTILKLLKTVEAVRYGMNAANLALSIASSSSIF